MKYRQKGKRKLGVIRHRMTEAWTNREFYGLDKTQKVL